MKGTFNPGPRPSSNWTGRTPRSMAEAFGPYAELPAPRRKQPYVSMSVLAALLIVFIALALGALR